MQLLFVLGWCVHASTLAFTLASQNLNGANYGIANMPQLGRNISLLERSKRYFDVYTPVISSLYSQVQWSTHSVALPADLVKEFDGRVINIVGYEFDIIRPQNPNAPCVSSTNDNPVPCNPYEQYNHHYGTYLFGKAARQNWHPFHQPHVIIPQREGARL